MISTSIPPPSFLKVFYKLLKGFNFGAISPCQLFAKDSTRPILKGGPSSQEFFKGEAQHQAGPEQ